MKINFDDVYKVPTFKVLKQPGILSFDQVFLNALNIGLALTLSKHIELDKFLNIIDEKINMFKESIEHTNNKITNAWKEKINNQINDCYAFLKKCVNASPSTFRKAIIFLKANTKNLCCLSSIWFLTINSKKPALCQTRKEFLFNMLIENNAQDLLSTKKPIFSCQEIEIKNTKYYSLLPTNWDVVDYFIWIKNTNYWTKYWRNFRMIFDYMNDLDFDELIVGSSGLFEPHIPVSFVAYSKNTYLAFNYVIPSRGVKNYQDNFSFMAELPELEKLVIHDCVNGYYLSNKK